MTSGDAGVATHVAAAGVVEVTDDAVARPIALRNTGREPQDQGDIARAPSEAAARKAEEPSRLVDHWGVRHAAAAVFAGPELDGS